MGFSLGSVAFVFGQLAFHLCRFHHQVAYVLRVVVEGEGGDAFINSL